jgi:hypothetical protein
VLMTTGYAEVDARLGLPMDIPLLMKPYDSAELGRRIRMVLRARAAAE